jgi:Ca2+-binding EF-hand superfamily protein
MEPEHNITVEDIIPIFKFFDANLDLKVTLKEVIELSRVKVTS